MLLALGNVWQCNPSPITSVMHGRSFTFTANNKGPITDSESSISTRCISQADFFSQWKECGCIKFNLLWQVVLFYPFLFKFMVLSKLVQVSRSKSFIASPCKPKNHKGLHGFSADKRDQGIFLSPLAIYCQHVPGFTGMGL